MLTMHIYGLGLWQRNVYQCYLPAICHGNSGQIKKHYCLSCKTGTEIILENGVLWSLDLEKEIESHASSLVISLSGILSLGDLGSRGLR